MFVTAEFRRGRKISRLG